MRKAASTEDLIGVFSWPSEETLNDMSKDRYITSLHLVSHAQLGWLWSIQVNHHMRHRSEILGCKGGGESQLTKVGKTVREVVMRCSDYVVQGLTMYDKEGRIVSKWGSEGSEDKEYTQQIPEGWAIVGLYGDYSPMGIMNLGFIIGKVLDI